MCSRPPSAVALARERAMTWAPGFLLSIIVLGAVSVLAGCKGTASNSVPTSETTIRLATTTSTSTSTENSGLLDELLPTFTSRHGIKVAVIPVGTGRALRLGKNGDVDVVLVHARDAEDRFVAEGYGVGRRDVM